MTRAAYFECFSGASGDMILGALVDAGWPESALRETLGHVPISGWSLDVRQVKKGAVHATQVQIRATEPQPERDLRDIIPLIERSDLPAPVIERAVALFRELAEVEGLEHDQPPETVHFHEVGAVDSILDIVGACAGLHALGIERLVVSPINVGGGVVPTRDGILPVPGPAALELLRRRGAPIYASEYGPELLTPTGALVLATLADDFGPFPPMRVRQIGYGAGQKDFAIPNVLRVTIGDLAAGWTAARPFGLTGIGLGHAAGRQRALAPPGPGRAQDPAAVPGRHEDDDSDTSGEELVVQLETNIDDMNPEWYGYLSERLMAEGALDVTLTPLIMKKGRPGTLVTVLVTPDQAERALATLFEETTTLGVRVQLVARRTLQRQVEHVETPYGAVRVKLALLNGGIRSLAPEFDDCRAAATRAGVAIRRVYEAAQSALRTAPVNPSHQVTSSAAGPGGVAGCTG